MDAQAETFAEIVGNVSDDAGKPRYPTCALTGNIHRDKIRANQIKFLINSY